MMAKLALFLVLCGALALAGCQSGTLVDEEQTCESSGALFAQKKATCNGSVGAVRGSPQLAVVDTDGNLEGSYRLEATVSVGRGTTKAHVSAAGGKQIGGEVSPGHPLRISAPLELGEDDEEVSVDLKVSGEEVEDLSYEATLVPQG